MRKSQRTRENMRGGGCKGGRGVHREIACVEGRERIKTVKEEGGGYHAREQQR